MLTILLVDDDDEVRLAVEKVLRQRGHAVVFPLAPPFGDKAVELLQRERVDAVIVDLLLGPTGFDGFELARRMQAHPLWCNIPLFISSGLDEFEIQRKAFSYAFSGLRTLNVGKPPEWRVLFAALEEIEGKKLSDEDEPVTKP